MNRTSNVPAGEDRPEELRREIAQTRSEMSETIEAIEGKLRPDVLKEQAKEKLAEVSDTVRHEVRARIDDAKDSVREATIGRARNMMDRTKRGARDAGSNFVDRIRENPIPAAMTGIGLAWLLFGGRKQERSMQRFDYDDDYDFARDVEVSPYGEEIAPYDMQSLRDENEGFEDGLGDRARRASEQARAKVEGTVERVRDKASHALHETQDRGRQLARRTRDRAADMQGRARVQARRLEGGFERMYRENPIAVGAAAIAVGTMVGLSLPRTEREDELLGATRDRLIDRAQDLAHEGLEKAKETVQSTVSGQGAQQGEMPRTSRPSIGSA
jgi:ElaB/YqjD/DUF883 family membrane-anchored ribosome-binding protein